MIIRRTAAFSLIELVIAMVLTAIVVGMASQIIVNPINIYAAISERITLTDDLEFVMQKVARDMRQAAPHSLRLKQGTTLQTVEFLHVAAGGRYHEGSQNAGNALDFGLPDTDFVVFSDWANTVSAQQLQHAKLLIYNSAAYGLTNGLRNYDDPTDLYNAYSYQNYNPSVGHVMTNSSQIRLRNRTVAGNVSVTEVNLQPGHRFILSSSLQRVYLIDTPVSYQCYPDPVNGRGTFTRYSGYDIQARRRLTPVAATSHPASFEASVLLNNVHHCEFIYEPELQQSMSAPILTLVIEIGDINGEIIRLHKRIGLSHAS